MNVNQFWPSKVAGVEAWSSAWTAEPKARHAHDCYQITVTRSGRGLIRMESGVHVCELGEIVVLHPGEVHELQPCDRDVWQFDTLYLPTLSISPGGTHDPTRFSSSPIVDATLDANFGTLHRSVVRRSDGLLQGDALQNMLARLAEVGGAVTAHPRIDQRALVRVQEFLNDNVETPVTLADLAAIAGVGQFHLTRTLRQAFGLPPHAYHVQVRVNRARALLKNGVPVVDVAARTGFADQAHLTRHFKRLVGVTPGRYRATSRTFKTGEA